MSAAINTGGPAFPSDENINTRDGMTLRDYFAAKAMQAWLVGVENPKIEGCVKSAYEIADAMLAARQSGAGQADKPAPAVAADPFVKLTSHSGEIIDLREVETIMPRGTYPDECTLVMRSGSRWSVSGGYGMTAAQSAAHWRDRVSAAKNGGAA